MEINRSLASKLTLTTMATISFVSVGTLLVVMGLQHKAEKRTLADIESRIESRLVEKGNLLATGHGLALRGLVAENAFTEIRELVSETVSQDSEIVYGLYVAEDDTLMVVSGLLKVNEDSEAIKERLKLTPEVAALELRGARQRRFTLDGEQLVEFVNRLTLDEEYVGTVRFGISLKPMEMALDRARNNSSLNRTRNYLALSLLALIAMGVAYLLMRRQSAYITQPLALLTQAAQDIAEGETTVRVKIQSGDEMEVLGEAFNRMAGDLSSSYEALSGQNLALAIAQEQLEEMNRGLEKKVEVRTRELKSKAEDIDNMLNSMSQGIFTILKDLSIHHEYSTYLETMFKQEGIAGRPALELLFFGSTLGQDEIASARVALLNAIGANKINFRVNCHLLPVEITRNIGGELGIWEVDWNPILSESNVVTKVMVTLRDVTALRALQLEMRQKDRELEVIGKILAVSPESMLWFISSADELLAESLELVKGDMLQERGGIDSSFRAIHTLKGNARTLRFSSVADLVHVLEEDLRELRDNPDAVYDREKLLQAHQEVKIALEEYSSVYSDKLEGVFKGYVPKSVVSERILRAVEEQLNEYETSGGILRLEALGDHIREIVTSESSVRVSKILSEVATGAEVVARELNKPAPMVVLRGADGLAIPVEYASTLRNVFIHLLNNCVDHGIESESQRTALGKAVEGTVTISVKVQNNDYVFEVFDDGCGLDMDSLREKARILGKEDILNDEEELADLVFLPGVSTVDVDGEASLSGRGVGMNAVRSFLEGLHGTADIELTGKGEGKGRRPCKVILRVPVLEDLPDGVRQV